MGVAALALLASAIGAVMVGSRPAAKDVFEASTFLDHGSFEVPVEAHQPAAMPSTRLACSCWDGVLQLWVGCQACLPEAFPAGRGPLANARCVLVAASAAVLAAAAAAGGKQEGTCEKSSSPCCIVAGWSESFVSNLLLPCWGSRTFPQHLRGASSRPAGCVCLRYAADAACRAPSLSPPSAARAASKILPALQPRCCVSLPPTASRRGVLLRSVLETRSCCCGVHMAHAELSRGLTWSRTFLPPRRSCTCCAPPLQDLPRRSAGCPAPQRDAPLRRDLASLCSSWEGGRAAA